MCRSQWPRGLGRSSVEIVGSNPAGGDGYLSAVSAVHCQVEVPAAELITRSE